VLIFQWYPKGGFYQVPASIQRIAEKNGAKFHFSTPVKCVTYNSDNKATGVMLGNGQKHTADIVVVNSDLTWSYNNLFVKEGEEGSDAAKKAVSESSDVKTRKNLLDPRKANQLVQKPHSYVFPLVEDIS
jgi:phytoene dehydrogenase-like protein